MKPLATEIARKGFVYYQMFHSEYGYLYRQTSKGRTVGFEVFKHRVNKAREFAGEYFPDSVAFPGDEAFGTWAWVYKDLDAAMDKYTSLLLNAETASAHE